MEFNPRLLAAISAAHSITALTGAGISKESGIPTFREAQTGLWAQYDPMELATPQAFQRNPRLVWEWYQWRRDLVSRAEPNPGHHALVELAKFIPNFHLITQNVDGYHQQAGSRNVIELHGNITRTICSKERTVHQVWEESDDLPPSCPDCGAYLRPDVVWFGENLPAGAISQAYHHAENAQIFFSIGTSSLVEPAASLARLAAQGGAILVEINLQDTPLTPIADYFLCGPSGVILPKLVSQLKRDKE